MRKKREFIVLQLCKSFYAPEITSPHSVGEFLKRQRFCGPQPGERETSTECQCVGAGMIFLVELRCRTGLDELFVFNLDYFLNGFVCSDHVGSLIDITSE